MGNRIVRSVVLGGWTLAGAACGGAATPPAASSTPAAAASVFFVTPKNGDTIKPLSNIEFGSTGTTISAVPPGELKPEQVRAGMIHYHLGLDTDCLGEGGVAIPKADPWIHFGQGNNTIEMQLTPGPHRLVVQAGDDLHRTLPGMCQVINVTVAP